MSKILEAAAFIASDVHEGQTRACGVEPYIEHCKRVSGMLARDFSNLADDDTIAAAILHDTLEDCPFQSFPEVYLTINDMCGQNVAAFVEILTKPRDHKECSNLRYLNGIAIAPAQVQTIKAIDRIDNLVSMTNIDWSFKRMQHYIQDSQKIRDILHRNRLSKQAELLNVHIVSATSRVASSALSNHG